MDDKGGLDRFAAQGSGFGFSSNSANAATQNSGLPNLPSFSGLLNLDESQDEAKRKGQQNEEDPSKRFRSAPSNVMEALLQQMEQMRQAQEMSMQAMAMMLQQFQNFSSAAPSAPGVVAETNLQQHLAENSEAVQAVAQALNKKELKIPEEIRTAVVKHMKRSGERIQKNIRAQKRLDKAQEDVALLKEDSSRYPPGTRPFRFQNDLVELDEPLPEAADSVFRFVVEVPAGATRKEALALLHHYYTSETKRINCEAMEIRVNRDKDRCKKNVLVNDCLAIVASMQNIDKLGLDDPEETADMSLHIRKLVEDEYSKMVENVRKAEHKLKLEEDAKKAKAEKQANELKSTHPTSLMRDVVESIVEKKVNDLTKDQSEAMEFDAPLQDPVQQAAEEEKLQKVCNALQKTGRPLQVEARGAPQKPPPILLRTRSTWKHNG